MRNEYRGMAFVRTGHDLSIQYKTAILPYDASYPNNKLFKNEFECKLI